MPRLAVVCQPQLLPPLQQLMRGRCMAVSLRRAGALAWAAYRLHLGLLPMQQQRALPRLPSPQLLLLHL